MEYYAIFIPNNTSNFAIKSFYNDKIEALAALKLHKDARMKAFSSSEEAVYFYLHGPSETAAAGVGGGAASGKASLSPGSPIPSADRKVPKSPFVGPSSQKLVAFRKLIEANNIDEVRTMIQQNPRYLISSGDTPTILKEGPRYNALHITAIEGRSDICRLILQTIENPSYIELLHGQRTSSTEEVTAILLDLYLNTPDKCRNETPLHFAAKLGWVSVVRELIAFPQCLVKPNADGLYPREIICSRAKPVNNTPEVREAIGALLQENYFVPVLRTEDNSLPPIVGEPFSPTDLHKLREPMDKLTARREIKAYAGPMDYEKAQRFCKRWKTPPRLRIVGGSQVRSEGKLAEMRKCSTPIKAAARRLFANRSFDGRLEEGAGSGDGQKMRNLNNNTLLDSSLDESIVESLEEKLIPDDNGNHVRMHPVPYTPNRLFFSYRSHLANSSFDTDGSYCDNDLDDGNISYVCDETQTLYGKSNVTESPSFKERSIRLTDQTKGIETIGRMLAKKEQVAWIEYWKFLGAFCNVEDPQGLSLLEQYLAQKRQRLAVDGGGGGETDIPREESVDAESPDPKERSFNDELNMICESTEKMSLNMANELLQPTAVSNPYRCLLNSLHVFGKRLVNNILKPNAKMRLAETFQGQIRQLEKLLENYRNDGAFRKINFSKVHALFAYLIVTNVAQNWTTRGGEEPASSVWKFLHAGGDDDSLNEPAKCVVKLLVQFSGDRTILNATVDFGNLDEMELNALWESNGYIVPCGCRTETSTAQHHAGKGILERMNKRREKRAYRTSTSSSSTVPATELVVDFHTYRSTGRSGKEEGSAAVQLNGSGEEDERYYSCSDSEYEQDDDTFFTPPSSPKALLRRKQQDDQNGNQSPVETAASSDEVPMNGLLEQRSMEEDENYATFLAGSLPTQDDFDVWNVLKMVDVDPQTYPHVYEWKCAMMQYSL
ncbi:ankyrin repeat and LEM domain-containing protein 2 homolog [Anopheles maculipalpis]|uniref:ankyrin repeat and LEM domain-containing protein 2 homolog n=1 Tax=Anopheles maculipalpis TaxID=1496333 RepID=UPI00215941FD|nr:ankyrin repeat and LEM domain-containing protein 2 homolog [Anopheles maculipalpis]